MRRNLALLLIGMLLPLFLNEESQGQWFPFSRAQVRYRKCMHLYEAGDYPEARECIRQFLSDYPDSRWSEALYFIDAKMETNAPNAVKKYQWFLQTYSEGPYAPEAAFLLGELYELTGDFSEARQAYMRVYLYFPASCFSNEAGLRGAKCMLLDNDIPSALKHLEEYLSFQPDYPWNIRAKELYADTLYQEGAYESAQEEYRQIISEIPQDAPRNPRWYLQIAKIYDLVGDRESALQCYTQFLKIFPNSAMLETAQNRVLELSNILHVHLPTEKHSHLIEAGAFSNEPDAAALVTRLKEFGYQAYVKKADSPVNPYSVRLGPYKTKELAEIITEKLKKETGLDALVLSGDASEREISGD